MVKGYVITGAPGTGKTALLGGLSGIGAVVPEPALITEHREATGEHSLDGRPDEFVSRLLDRSVESYDRTFAVDLPPYDRGIPDCAAYALGFGLDPGPAMEQSRLRRYADPVFLLTPWEEIYKTDDMRQATYSMIAGFHDLLVTVYSDLGYQLVEVPQADIAERAEFVKDLISGPS
ncbi:MAG: AAA family ATPase [Acidimicrobiia bacterium]|nr:AAA family ATPase [Acidimicrobiia bacterium]MDH4307804.1 AAA family ATPase [Acidimicrobiia bacterium]MDH5292348.1 AAA family ATPase [Acidimicrobiia bacterium]